MPRDELGAEPDQPGAPLPAGIVRLLGYVPWAAGASAGERPLAYPRERGLSQTTLARVLGIDPGTLGLWERNLREPTGRYARVAEAFLGA